MDRFHDSAGVPWEGREFSENSFASDDGSTPPALANLFAAPVMNKRELFHALENSRLLIPLVAQLGESEIGAHGQKVDKSAELSVVAVSTPDNQTALPVFSSVEQMKKWNLLARPVPVESRRVALAAIAEGHTRVVLDAAGRGIVLRRPMLAALAQSVPWSPPHESPAVMEAVEQARANSSSIVDALLLDGDIDGSLAGPELIIQLSIKPGLKKEDLDAELTGFTNSLQSTDVFKVIDSVAYKVVSA